MERLRKRIRKVMAGITAFLLTCLQFMGSIDMPHVPIHYGMVGYTWTDYGIRAKMYEEEQQAREQQRREQEHMARLEGEVREEQLRADSQRERNHVRERDAKEKTAS